MPTTTIKNVETCSDTTKIVTTDTATNETITETIIDNQTITTQENCSDLDACQAMCPCGDLDLRKLVEETRCWAFKSSNVAAATGNAVIIFAMRILQEILISECESGNTNIDNVFLIAAAIGNLGEVLKIYNPQPFNS